VAIDAILVDVSPGETRVALMDAGRLVELMVARDDDQAVTGNIYFGRVEKTLSGIQAAFVDIGLERSGFLATADARPAAELPDPKARDKITDYVSKGDALVVQVLKDPVPGKGARVTMRPTLPGRHLVLTPGHPGVRISHRIDSGAESDRLAEMIEELAEGGEGYILRTGAAGVGREAFVRDIEYLRDRWDRVVSGRAQSMPPARLHEEADPVIRTLRDSAGLGVARVVFDDAAKFEDARAFCRRLAPELGERLQLHSEDVPLFRAHAVEEQIDGALAATVDLSSGGTIIFDETAALCAIDVNTGSHSAAGGFEETALGTNLEAAEEIARQIRLRNLAGLIVVDFVPMRRYENGAAVLERLREAVADDRCPTRVAGFTRLGLMELTRERRRLSLSQLFTRSCPACEGQGRITSAKALAYEVLRRVLAEARAAPGAALTVRAHPDIVDSLRGPGANALDQTEDRIGARLELVADPELGPDRFEVAATKMSDDPGRDV
jgi:ribonuclease G